MNTAVIADRDIYPGNEAPSSTTAEVLSQDMVIPSASAWQHLVPLLLKVRIRGGIPIVATSRTIERLYGLLSLPENWNSYGAARIRRDVIDFAATWVTGLFESETTAPAIVPTARGGVQVEWHRCGVDLEIYVDSPSDVRFSAEDQSTGQLTEAPLEGNEHVLRDWIARISN